MKKSMTERSAAKRLQKLRADIETFQKSVINSSGKLPKKFAYPRHLVVRVAALKRSGMSPNTVAKALGLSSTAIYNWFSNNVKKGSPPPAREIRIEDLEVSRNSQMCARIIFKNGIVMELNGANITPELIRNLNVGVVGDRA